MLNEPPERGTLKVALYARVSTTDKGQTPEVQLTPLREYCQRMNWQVDQEFVDFASGVKLRPELQALKAECDRRRFDMVLVWKLDRLGRSLQELTEFVKLCQAKGVMFRSHTEGFDTTTSQGMLLFQIMGALAEFEHNLIAERVKAGMAYAASRGKQLGRPRVPIPADRILALRASGLGYHRISNQLSLEGCQISSTTIKRFLKLKE